MNMLVATLQPKPPLVVVIKKVEQVAKPIVVPAPDLLTIYQLAKL